ncbi:MAG: hypothetical protein ACYTGB_08100 [Planctomycetota bacterium]|jgi:hypothetical protein
MRSHTLIAAALLGLLAPRAARALEAPINVIETAGVERKAEPVSIGVPVPRGALKAADLAKLCVISPAGEKVPAQFEVLGWWWPTERHPDKQRSIRWVLCDFQADVPAKGRAAYKLSDAGGNPKPAAAVSTAETKNAVKVSTGPLAITIRTDKFRLFEEVTLSGKPVVAAAENDGMCVEDVDGERYYASKDCVAPPRLNGEDYRKGYDDYLKACQHNPPEKLRVNVERSGPMRAVILIDGVIQAQKPGKEYEMELFNAAGDSQGKGKRQSKDEKLGFRIRVHAYAGKSFVRVFHTIINLRGKSHTGTDQNRYRSALYMADAVNHPGRFVIESLELGTTLKLEGEPKYLFGGDEVHSGTLARGKKAVLYQDSSAGWIWQAAEDRIYDPLLSGNIKFLKVKPGLEKPYYEYSDIHYKILKGQDGCSFMGYRLLDGEGKRTAGGNRAAGWVDVSGEGAGMTAAVRWFWQMFPKSLEVDGAGRVVVGVLPRQWRRGHFLDGKIHRTHELFYRFHGAEKAEATAAAARAFEVPLVGHCGAEWYIASGACNFFARPDPENWPLYEGQIRTAVHCRYNEKQNHSFDSSYEVEREKEDCYGWQHFGDTAKRGFRGFSQFEEFDSSRCLIMHFWRTGDPAFFQEAEKLDRWLMGVPCFGGGYGHQHPERSHNWIQGLIDYYSMTGLPEAGEAIDAMKGYYEFSKNPSDFCWNYNGRNAAYAVNGLRQMFEWTGDPAWLTAANRCIRYCLHGKRMRGVSGFYGGNPGWFMTHVLCHALGRYAELTGDEDAVDWVVGLSGHFKPFSNRCDGGGASADCYAHAAMLTGEERYMAAAIKDMKDSMTCKNEKGPHYRTGGCSSKTWTGSVGGYWQVFFYAAREWKPADTKPPAAITDLAVEPGPEAGTVKVSWTNTGDDGAEGQAAKIQLKYAEGEIVEFIPWGRAKKVDASIADEWKGKVNYWYARNAKGEPAPGKSGEKQGCTLKGLPSGKTVHFAATVHDEAMNRSKLSNVVKVAVP